MNISHSKKDIRKSLQRERRLLSVKQQQEKSSKIIENVRNSEAFLKAEKVAFYHAVGGEANPASLSQQNHKQFYLPVLSDNKDQGLVFALINTDTQYKNNQFSIPEPICKEDEYIAPESLDLVLMPLLGFDSKGNRLGMGGGYYDRCFAFKKKQIKIPLLMGFAYDFQEVQGIQKEPWDIGLDLIATESKIIIVS